MNRVELSRKLGNFIDYKGWLMNRMGCDYKLPGISGTTVDVIAPLLNITLWDFSPVAYHWSGALPQEYTGRSFGRMLIIFSCRGSQKPLLAQASVSSSYQSIFDEYLSNLASFFKASGFEDL